MAEKKKSKWQTALQIDAALNQKVDGVIKFSVDNVFPKYLELYQNFFCDESWRASYLKSRQSNLIVPLMYIVIMTYYASLFDVVFGFNVSAANPKDTNKENKKKEDLAKDALTRAFQQWWAKNKMFAALLDCLICSDWYLVSYRHRETDTEAYTKKWEWAKEDNYSVEYPSLKVYSPFKVFYNKMSYNDFYKTPMVTLRDVMPLKNFINEYSKFVELSPADIKKLSEWTQDYFLDEDRDAKKIKSLYWGQYEGDKITTMNEKYIIDDVFVEVIEVRTNHKVRILVNKFKVYEWDNPYPLKRKPIYQISTKDISWTAGSMSMGHVLLPIQKTASGALNAYIDEMKLKAVPIVFKTAGATMFKNVNNITELTPWSMYTVENDKAVFPLQRWWANIQLQNLLDYLLNLWFQATAMNSYTVWGVGNKIERSAQGVVSRTQVLKTQLIPLFQMMNGTMGRIAKMWLAMMKANLDDWTIIKIFDEKNSATLFKKFTAADIEWQFDVIFDSEELVNAEKQLKVDNIMKFIWYVWNISQNPATQLPTMDLSKFVKSIAEYMWIDDEMVFETIKEAASYVEEWELAKIDIQEKVMGRQQEIQMQMQQTQQWAVPQEWVPQQAPQGGMEEAIINAAQQIDQPTEQTQMPVTETDENDLLNDINQ